MARPRAACSRQRRTPGGWQTPDEVVVAAARPETVALSPSAIYRRANSYAASLTVTRSSHSHVPDPSRVGRRLPGHDRM